MCTAKPEGEIKTGVEIKLVETKPEGKTKMGVETVVQGNAHGKAKVTRSEVPDKASVQDLNKVIAVTNESGYKQVMSRSGITMQIKKVEIITKPDNTEMDVFKKSKTK
eukprot:15327094-Ditylum_brightwellii.AAC.1